MSFPIQTIVVNPTGKKKHKIGPLDAQVSLVNKDGTAFTGFDQHTFGETIGNASTNMAAATAANPTKDEYNKLATAYNTLAAQFNALVAGLAASGISKLPDKK